MNATFPLLSTGAVAQYPTAQITSQGAQVIRFLDGTDQRYLTQANALRRWQIRLDQLNEGEIFQLESFFAQQSGNYSIFSFPDPFSGTVVPNCRFGTEALETSYVGVDVSSAVLWVIETNG